MAVSPEAYNPGQGPPPAIEESMTAQARQARFEASLRTVRMISDHAGKELPMHSVEDPHLIPHEPGIYVLNNHIGASDRITDVSFLLKRQLLSGAADSAHSVIAGDLLVDYRDGTQREVKVAVKCYAKRTAEERYNRAMREITVMEDLLSCEELSIEPIAAAIASPYPPFNGEVILLTRYNDMLLSLDNLPWGRGVEDRRNVNSARLAVQALGRFNAHLGYVHGDAKIKNVAIEHGDGIGMIDFETTEEFDRTSPAEAARASNTDFGFFLDSLQKKGFITPGFSRANQDAITLLATDYLDAWVGAPQAVQAAVLEDVTNTIARHGV